MYTTIINPSELVGISQSDDIVIIDCRFELSDTNAGRIAYTKAHLPNAEYAHLDDDLSGEIILGTTGRHPLPKVETFVKTLSLWGINNHKQVVVYDDKGGAIAARLWWMLQWLGHEKVAILNGGIQAWKRSGYELTDAYSSPIPTIFTPNLQSDMVVEVEMVEQVTKTATHHLIDARANSRYSGENEPIDPVAGHIPSAISLPFMGNWTNQKTMLDQKDLKERFEKAIAEKGIENTIVYCGSGVTACHNILAIKHAGLGMAKLYAGSWSHWITEGGRSLRSKT